MSWFDDLVIGYYTSEVPEKNLYYPSGLILTNSMAGVKEQTYRVTIDLKDIY